MFVQLQIARALRPAPNQNDTENKVSLSPDKQDVFGCILFMI